ncbi:MAG: GTPase, partial [bacterium]|nr:GTPase [bacterium]
MAVQWFPGHMAKARKLLETNIKLVDIVIELRDARLPLSSANPILEEIAGQKARCLALTKPDLADAAITRGFIEHFSHQGIQAFAVNARDGKGIKELISAVKQMATSRVPKDKVSGKPLRGIRVMIAGIPNVGKSSLINSLAGKYAAKTGALPGLTRSKQWIGMNNG